MHDVQGSRAAPPGLFHRCLDLKGRPPAQMYLMLHQYRLIPVHYSGAQDCVIPTNKHDLGTGLLTPSPCIQGLLLFLGLGFTKTLSPIANSLSCFDARLS